jgi:hypothetical protein
MNNKKRPPNRAAVLAQAVKKEAYYGGFLLEVRRAANSP